MAALNPLARTEAIRFLTLLWADRAVCELRVPKHNKYKQTASGYFTTPEELVDAALRFDGKASMFVTLNPVSPALLARANNRVIDDAEHASADSDVLARKWLFIDCDPKRPAGISSTDEERDAAVAFMQALVASLMDEGWPAPLTAMSGNGAYALYRVDLPNTPEITRLIEGVLKALAARFSSDHVHIDTSVTNAARIVGLIGTTKTKGENHPERPHRRSHLIDVPDELEVVGPDLLESAAGAVPAKARTKASANTASTSKRPAGASSLAERLTAAGYDYREQPPDANGVTWYHLHRCLFHDDGRDFECGVGQKLPDGPFAGHCFHPEGQGKTWQEWKAALGLESIGRAPDMVMAAAHPYREANGGLVLLKSTQHGDMSVPLTNFTARIVGQVIEDDGAEEHLFLELEATHRGKKVSFTIPGATFSGMQWPLQYLGADAVVHAGATIRDHARAAIQFLSGEVPVRRAYAHTGWRTVEGQRLFLHAGGAIGADGHHAEVEVHLPGNLGRVDLPPPPQGDTLRTAVAASFGLLSMGPLEITAPLLGATYLAPLREFLGDDRYDLLPWMVGDSGSFKSEDATLGQAHYGAFTRQTLPANFLGTANSLEGLLFRAKDILIVVDDYYPENDRARAQAMAAVASRLARSVGNNAGRGRMRADTTLRPDMPPRGLALATGELLPEGYSSAARLFQIPVLKGSVTVESLSAAQHQSKLYPAAMAGYLQWLAQHADEMGASLSLSFREYRSVARGNGHAREPGQVAHLFLGLDTFLRFATEVGVITEPEHQGWRDRAWTALLSLAASQRRDTANQHPVARFLALLHNGFAARTAFLEAPDGGPPPDATRWGWSEEAVIVRGEHDLVLRHPANAAYLGWVDHDWLYLIPEAAYQFVLGAAAKSGQVFPTGDKVLLKLLESQGWIAVEAGGRRTVKVRRGPDSLRVIKLRRRGPGTPEPSGDASRNVPDLGDAQEIGNTIGNIFSTEPGTESAEFPDVPDVPPDLMEGGKRTTECSMQPAMESDGGVLSTLGEHREQGEQPSYSVPAEAEKLFPISSEDREHASKIGNKQDARRVEV